MQTSAPHDGRSLGQTPRVYAVPSQSGRQSASASANAPARLTYLTLTGIARKFVVSERTAHKIVGEPWFPAPVQLFNSDRGHRRWIEEEIDDAIATSAPRTARKSEPDQLRLARERKGQEATR